MLTWDTAETKFRQPDLENIDQHEQSYHQLWDEKKTTML
jgi:hypothetical protein